MHPKVSVIIAAYNSEKHIEKCLDSIFNQTFKDFEVIVVNDGSTDRTKKVCVRYATEHNNMILVNQENGGIATARNKGLEVCHGDYIAFSDSDDYMEVDWLQHFMDAIDANPECDIAIEGLLVDYNDKINHVPVKAEKYEGDKIIEAYQSLKSLHIEGFLFNKIYNRKIIEENNIRFEYTLKEDLLFNLKYLYYTTSLITISSSCYHYIQHGSQSLIHRRYTANYMKDLITSLYDASIRLSERYPRNGFRKKIIEEYMLSYSVLLFSMYNRTNGITDKAERIRYIQEYQKIRKANRNIKITMGNKTKRLFASFMMMPAIMTDLLLSVFLRKCL